MSRGGEGELHRRTVAAISERFGLQRRGFRRAIAKAFPHLAKVAAIPHRVPDAFEIHKPEREIIAHEVEVTCVLNAERLDAYAKLWFDLDSIEVGFALVRWGAHNGSLTCKIFDLQKYWYDRLYNDRLAL